MLTEVQMVILVVAVLVAGAISSIIFYYLQKCNNSKGTGCTFDFTSNATYGKMLNSDISIDEVIKDFKLLD